MGTHPIFESDFDCLTGMQILGYICVGTVLGSSNTDNLRVTKYVGTKSAKKLTKTNRLADFETNIPEVFSEWELSVKLQLKANPHSDWSNVFAIQADHDNADDNLWHGDLGDRIPAVYLHGGKTSLHICNAINDNWNHCWNTPELRVNRWHTLNMKQWRNDEHKYMYTISVDDGKGNKWDYEIENENPKGYNKPKAEFANGLPLTANGRFKGFTFKTRRAMTPFEKLEIFVTKFKDIIEGTIVEHRNGKRLSEHAEQKMKPRLRKLKEKCDIPKIWDPRGEKNDERALNSDPCIALGQIEIKMGLWSDIYNQHCKKPGIEDAWKEKSLKKIGNIINKTKEIIKRKNHCI